ncbi:CMGC family protein kinase [Trichomonas vaginalis G3]|uniref:CMGC family protein kinase n=1 Tax=Trichomonas vaginalis (strain ATCC PRA-98 / G3) TaxID=412133 RepID=A2FNC2_TRIV3|nr:protein kinase protein [Trichomonas vaginalis G3]EAX93585.1 CMGC family protein kinase [Trichomonas vaginalis G3]KAI5541214.1 protein kinase protein [Trichomonas vaginalis G3]|eukprot:XP_001306515.1 CMGC family protein kinase [Trichomonas vaginalis G3]
MKPKTITQRPINRSQYITQPENTDKYRVIEKIGSGTFGNIYAIEYYDRRRLALKKVLQDPKYKNRELTMIQALRHPNCLKLHQYELKREGDQEFLYIFTDLLPTDLHKYLRKNKITTSLAKIFGYQLFNGLDYLHKINITHRDIKSSNILVDPDTGILKICDFGSAKELKINEASVSYISTRSYRAPELLYESQFYTSKIDVWAAGCVLSEMFKGGDEIFHADSNQSLKQIILNFIGTPTISDFHDMNLQLQPQFYHPGIGIEHAFNEPLDPLLLDLLKKIFVYSPVLRYTAEQAKYHPFFAEVRNGTARLPNGALFRMPIE